MKTPSSLQPLTTTALVPSDMRTEIPRPFSIAKDPFPVRQVPVGMGILFAFICIVGLWFGMAPINSAIVSPGVVQVASHRKTIQHFEGGIVDEILVRNGDIVVRDQPLIKLRSVYPAAEMAQLDAQQLETLAVIGRLMAEQTGASEIALPAEFEARANEPDVQSIIAGQQQILDSFLRLQGERLAVLEQNIEQAQEEIAGRQLQIEARELQRKFLNEELALLETLFDQKLMSRTRVLEVNQQLARVDGDIGQYQAEIARIKKNVLETRLQINEMRAAETLRVTQQLREERAKLFDITQRLTAARDVYGRTTIMSPVDGEVVNMQVHTANGVISAGQPIMDIVPQDDELIIQAFVDPNDIDEVRVGMPADIRLTSLTRRSRVPIEGVVTIVSPDRLVDAQSGRAYYEARIEVAPTVHEIDKHLLMAGMGADVFIRTGERTALQYLMEPFLRSFQMGFREK
jgi:membrane fusion protein, epimerase transport system